MENAWSTMLNKDIISVLFRLSRSLLWMSRDNGRFSYIFQLNHAKTRLYLRQRLECRHRRPLSMKGPVQPVHTQGPESAKLARHSSDMLRLLSDLQLLR